MAHIDQVSRLDIARGIWDMFITDIRKARIHYGKKYIFIVVEMKDDYTCDGITEASITDRNTYSETRNVPLTSG